MKFDISAARSAGYSDDEIAEYLSQEKKFDLAGALGSGYTASEVVGFLSEAPKVTDTGDETARLAARYPAPQKRQGWEDNAEQLMRDTAAPAARPTAPKPAKAAEPKPYANRVEALDDAVNLIEEGYQPEKVAEMFSRGGITMEDIATHGQKRGSEYFKQQAAAPVDPETATLARRYPAQPAGEIKASDYVPKSTGLQRVEDVGREVSGAAIAGFKGVADVAGADNAVGEALGKARDIVLRGRSGQAKAVDQLAAYIMEEAENKGLWEQIKAGSEAFMLDPLKNTSQGAGSIVPAIVGGKVLAATKVVQGIGNLGAAMLGRAGGAVAAQTAGGSLVGGAMGVGMAKSQIYDTVKQDALESGYSAKDAERVALKAQEYSENPAVIFGAGALGLASGGIGVEPALARMMGKTAVKELAQAGVIKSTVKGVLAETPLESGQGGFEALAGNVASRGEGFDVGLTRGVGTAAAMEGWSSAGPGGAMGAAEGVSNRLNDPKRLAARELSAALEGGQFTESGIAADVANRVRTDSATGNITPAATVMNFTPADSLSAQAGLAPIIVPVPTGAPDVSTGVGTGSATAVGGVQPGDLGGASLGTAGLGGTDAGQPGGGSATGLAPLAGTAGAVPDGATQRPATLSRPLERATDTDLLARAEQQLGAPQNNNADTAQQPMTIWTGRAGDGYATMEAAQAGLKTRMNREPELRWAIEQMPSGKFRLAGYEQNVQVPAETSAATPATRGLPDTGAAAPAVEAAGVTAPETVNAPGEKRFEGGTENAEGSFVPNLIGRRVGSQVGIPYATEAGARKELDKRGLAESHEIIEAATIDPSLNGYLIGIKPQPATEASAPITAPSGLPFSTEKTAAVYAQQNGITDFTTQPVDGGFVIQPAPAAAAAPAAPAAQAVEPILAPTGQPFSTEKTAAVFAQQNGITGYSTIRMGGGWAIQPAETTHVTGTPQAEQAAAQGQQAPEAAQPDLALPQGPLSDADVARLGSNPQSGDVRNTVQQKLNEWAARNGSTAPQLGTPDAEAEAGVNVLGALLGEATGLGQKVIAYSNKGGENGFAYAGYAFVNTSPDVDVSAPRTALHEIKHVVERMADADTKAGLTDTPAQKFVAQIDGIFDDMTDAGKRAYVEKFLHKEELGKIKDPAKREARLRELVAAPKTRSEMTADFLGNRAQDREFLTDLAKADPQGFEGFVRKWLSVIDNLIGKLRGLPKQGAQESAKVDQYVRDLNKAKMVARDALIQFRKANAAQQQTDANAPAAGAEPAASAKQGVVDPKPASAADKRLAAAYEKEHGILPYTSEGQIEVPLDIAVDPAFSVKQKGKYGNHPVFGIPVNQNGTVTLYYPTTNEEARRVARDKTLRAAPGSNRVYLTNESSAPKVMTARGNIEQALEGANVLVQIDPNLLQLDMEHSDGRKDFFIPVAEGQTFFRKMRRTRLFTQNAPRTRALTKDTKLTDLERRISDGVNKYLSLSKGEQRIRLKEVKTLLKREHNVTTLLGVNGKLEKTNTGGYGLNNYDGKDVKSMGLGLASAQKINENNLSTCPKSAICESLCLGETSGQNLLYGGDGQYKSGPRLSQYLKTEAMVVHPEEFAILLHSEIAKLQRDAKKEDYQATVRLNVTSDFRPQTFEGIIKAFPDVVFYDYTKLPSKSIASNHHLTYSSTGASQVVDGKTIVNPESNWNKMVEVMRRGDNVAMAFSDKNTMPRYVVDEKTGERFQVWDGDNYDARFLDPKPGQEGNEFGKGMIIGLTNKDRTGKPEQAAEKNRGFFIDYNPERDGDTVVIRNQEALGSGVKVRPIQVVRKADRAAEESPAFSLRDRGTNTAMPENTAPGPQGDATNKNAPTSDKSGAFAGLPQGGMQERAVRAVTGSPELTQSGFEAGSGSKYATVPEDVVKTALERANKEAASLAEFDIQEELRSLQENGGGADLAELAQNPEFWDAEDEVFTQAGLDAMDRINEQIARERAGASVAESLEDLNSAHHFAQALAFESILDGLGVSYDKDGRQSQYFTISDQGTGDNIIKFRFSDHGNTVKDSALGQHRILFNVAPGGRSFTDAVQRLLQVLNDQSAPDTDGAPAFSKRAQPDALQDRSGISRLAFQGYEKAEVPKVQAARKLAGLLNKLDEGKITPESFELQVRLLSERMTDVSETKSANRIVSERQRGADIVREKLIAARRRGDLDFDTVEFALWALQQNPAIAEGLGVSVREQPEGSNAAGDYNPASSVMRIFKGAANADTGVHEIMHHTERMMPPEVQAGIRKEWAKQYAKALAKAEGATRAALEKIPEAMAGDKTATNIVSQAFSDGALQVDEHYQLTNPSEFWAVNASDILRGRYEAGSWVGKAKQWLGEMLEKVKGLLGMRSNAAVLKGLKAVMEGKGERLSKKMLTDLAGFGDVSSGRAVSEDQARKDGFTLKAYRGVSKASPFNDSGTTWLTTSREVAEAYAEEVMGYDDPGVITVMVKPDGLKRFDASRLTDEQREELEADGFGNPQAMGIYDRSDDHPLGGSRRNVTVIHAPREAVVVLDEESNGDIRFSKKAAPDTPAFRKWFGDSKVVDGDGKPLVFYHGGAPDFAGIRPGGRFGGAIFVREGAPSNYGSAQHALYVKGPILELSEMADLLSDERGGDLLAKAVGRELDEDEAESLAQALTDGSNYPESEDVWSLIGAIDEADAQVEIQKLRGLVAKRLGFEAVRTPDEFDGETVMILSPEQIKSATGNAGTFDPENPDIRFSRRAPPAPVQGQRFTLPAMNRRDRGRRVLQDDALRMKRVIEAVKKQGGTVGDAQNFYEANTLMPGRVQAAMDDFRDNVMKPLIDKAVAADIEMDELALFAYAKHAQERNDYIASINPRMPDGGSGMTTADANQILADVAAGPKAAAFDELHRDLMAITSTTRQLMLNEGLITQDEFDAMENAYANYIPLRGLENVDEDTGAARPGVGRGVNVRGRETIRALGRRSRASDLIENAIRDYQRAVARIEKNDVGKVLLDFVLSNPDPDLWGVDIVRNKAKFNERLGLVQYTNARVDGDDTIGIKVGGVEVLITFADKDLTRALSQAWKDEVSGMERFTVLVSGWWNNWLRNVLTRYNPAFAAINIPRDALWSGTTAALADLGPKGLALYTAAYGKALMASTRHETGATGTTGIFGNPQMDRYFTEFRAAGGITGGFYLRGLDDIATDLRNDMLQAGAKANNPWEAVKAASPYKLARGTLKALEFLGSASENATRFALYMAARQSGKSPQQAALLAKNGTTNFNRKGEWGGSLNNLYLFFNAAVQGTAQLGYVLKSRNVQAAMAGVASVGAMLALYGAAAGGEDDDGEAYWDKVPSHVKERNLVIMLTPGGPLLDGMHRVGQRGRYTLVPVQYGFNIFPNAGYVMVDAWRNAQDSRRGLTPIKAGMHMASVVFGSINPLGGAIDFTDKNSVRLALLPTIADLPYQLSEGIDGFGRPSAPFKMPGDPRPDSERMTTAQMNTVPQKIAKALNEMGGGNEGKAGSILGVDTSFSPGTIKTLISGTTGGLGAFSEQVVSSLIAMTSDDKDLKAANTPFLNKFYGEVDEVSNMRQAGERMRRVREKSDELIAQFKVGLFPTMDSEEERLLVLADVSKDYFDATTEMRKDEIAIIKSDMPEPQKQVLRKQIQAERDKLATVINRIYLDSLKEQKK